MGEIFRRIVPILLTAFLPLASADEEIRFAGTLDSSIFATKAVHPTANQEKGVALSAGATAWYYNAAEATKYWMYGPVLGVNGERWDVTFTYLLGEEGSYDRRTAELIAGYDFSPFRERVLNPKFGILLGYRDCEYESVSNELAWDGILYGLRSQLPLGRSGFSIFGSFSYIPDVTVKITSGETEVTGEIADAGLKFALVNVPLMFQLGYRWEQVSVFDMDYEGPILTIRYRF